MNVKEVAQDILTHHGTLGMKWGRRRASGSQPVVVTDKRKKIKTSGGKGFPAHADAIRARSIAQKGKKSGLKALSDQELQAYTKRINLEQSVKRATISEKSGIKKFIATLLVQTGKNQTNAVANEVATQQVKKHLTDKLNKTANSAA